MKPILFYKNFPSALLDQISLNSKGQWVNVFSMTGHPCQKGHHAKGGGAVTQCGWVMEWAQLLCQWNLEAASVSMRIVGARPMRVSRLESYNPPPC